MLKALVLILYNTILSLTLNHITRLTVIIYLIILKSKASIFYYNKILGRLYNFTKIIEITKTYFKTKEQ